MQHVAEASLEAGGAEVSRDVGVTENVGAQAVRSTESTDGHSKMHDDDAVVLRPSLGL